MISKTGSVVRPLARLGAAALLVAVLAVHGNRVTSAQELEGLTIGSGSVGADFFVLGTTLQQVLSEVYPDARIENSATSGSVENFRLLRRGEIDVGLFTTTSVVDAWDASGAFANEDPYKEIRVLSGAFHFSYNVITREDTGITTMSDLKGKRVGIGPDPATLTPLYSPFFEASGLDYEDDIEHVYASYADIYRMVGEGQIDAAVGFTSGFKAPASIHDLASAREIHWISFDQQELENAGLEAIVFPAGTLPDQKGPVVACKIGFVAMATTEQMSDDDAYAFVKAVHENLGDLVTLQPALGQAVNEPETLTTDASPYSYHPGAIRYWKEVGLWKE